MNVECSGKALEELTGAFRFSDAVLRHLVVKMDRAVTDPSPMAKEPEERDRDRDRDRGDRDSMGDGMGMD
jgi:small subunit ribosomal protein S6